MEDYSETSISKGYAILQSIRDASPRSFVYEKTQKKTAAIALTQQVAAS